MTAAPVAPPVPPARKELGGGRLFVLALACGVAVANVYVPQAITPLVARGLHVRPGTATLAATAAQLGYAAGIFLLVPLGDRVRTRPLVTALLLVTAGGLGVAAAAPTLGVLVAAGAVVGCATVVPQVLLPAAAGMVDPAHRGAVTGRLLSGLLTGVLLARAAGGGVAGWLGWRAPYLIAAVLAVLLVPALWWALPARRLDPTPTPAGRWGWYVGLLAVAVRLLRTEPALRRSCRNQAFLFGAFTAAWTALPLLVTGPTFRLGTAAVGLVALVGAGSVAVSPLAGRRVDRGGPDPVNRVCFAVAIGAAGVLLGGGARGAAGLVALFAGMLLLDVAVQAGQVANQARIFALAPEVRSRLNTAYMTCAFLGGSAGSLLGVRAYQWLGWYGVCGLVAVLAAVPLASSSAGAGRAGDRR